MKVFIFSLCMFGFVIISLAQNEDAKHGNWRNDNEWQTSIDECKTKTGASDAEVLHAMRQHKAENRNEQCMMACMKKKSGMMDENNKMSLDKAVQMYSHMKSHNPEMHAIMLESFKQCKTEEKDNKDECVAAKTFEDCLQSKKEDAMKKKE